MKRLWKKVLCWRMGHRWRPLGTLNIAPSCTLFDWPLNREIEKHCKCVRCGVDRPGAELARVARASAEVKQLCERLKATNQLIAGEADPVSLKPLP